MTQYKNTAREGKHQIEDSGFSWGREEASGEGDLFIKWKLSIRGHSLFRSFCRSEIFHNKNFK